MADELGVRRVVAPPAAGVLAALGLVMAGERRDYVQTVLARGRRRRRPGRAAGAARRARRARSSRAPPLRAAADCRYAGQSHSLTVDWDPAAPEAELAAAFHDAHAARYGDAEPGRPVEAVSLRLAAERPGDGPRARPRRASAPPVTGPAVIPMDGATCWVAEGWTARTDAHRRPADRARGARMTAMDPVTLQVMANALRAVAEEMEAALVRSAFSPNIKERRDCSTAIFDAEGRMVVQSASIPVHLGAMPEAVDAARARGAAPGEVWLVNDPYRGGTHLPDLTMISAMRPRRRRVAAYAVTRAHHADVGGMAPGSMPAGSRELLQEGLVIPPVRLARRRRGGGRRARHPARQHPHAGRARGRRPRPARRPPPGRAAPGRGGRPPRRRPRARGVRRPARTTPSGAPGPRSPTCRTAATRPRRPSRATASTEGDLWIRVAVTIAGDRMTVNFAGTDPAGPGNCNCPPAVTRSAVYFVVRCLTDPDIPASAGAFAPVEVLAPDGCLVAALPPAAVAGGNVETSSRIVNAVMAALGGADQRAGAGPGHDEQPHGRRARLHVLRDHRRRAGRVARRGRARRGSTWR